MVNAVGCPYVTVHMYTDAAYCDGVRVKIGVHVEIQPDAARN